MKTAFLAAASVAACAAAAHDLVDFSHPGHGWSAANHVADARQTETGYSFGITDEDPWCVAEGMIELPKPPPGAAYAFFELETAPVEDPRPFQLFWHAGDPGFNERESALMEPSGPAPCSIFAAELPVDSVCPGKMALRIDPPGKSEKFSSVEYRRLRVSYAAVKWKPSFSAPPPVAFSGKPLVLRGDGWELRHDSSRMGAFVFAANGKKWAEGYPGEPFVVQDAQGRPETIDWSKGTVAIEEKGAQIEACATAKDSSGRTWTWTRTFTAAGPSVAVRTTIAADSPAQVYHLPYMTLFVDRASKGHKRQALLPGIEYLADEPSSNEKDLRGPQANRLIPARHRLCHPMMAIADDTSWFAFEWADRGSAECPFATVFDTPDRQFKSGGHLFALWAPGIGAARRESDTRIFSAEPFESGAVETTLSSGAGGDVACALAARYPLARLPPAPKLDAAKACETLAAGWLDSGVLEGADGCRHALGANWPPRRAWDVPALMLWLASATPDAARSAKLTAAANKMLAAFPDASQERRGWGFSVSHVKNPVAPLVFGDPVAYSITAGCTAKELARQLADGKRIWHKPGDGSPDYGATLGADHCNGYSATSVSEMLACALWTGDGSVISDALAVLDKFSSIYGDDVPRGAQSWEIPLHTPDILASARLVECYTRGYLLSGDPRHLERARYWARTGMAMVYLSDPPAEGPNPVGRYATTGVIGATNWTAPNWIGLPVQWCGLVYSAALAALADIETDYGQAALWRRIARGITASGVDQCFPPDAGAKAGLLPDSFRLVKQERCDPPINPGTVQENVSNFIGLPYYRVVRATPGGNTLVHVPGRVKVHPPKAGELARVEVAAWPRGPYKVFFSRVQRPATVRANGASVRFRFVDNVMSVPLQPGGPVILTLEDSKDGR